MSYRKKDEISHPSTLKKSLEFEKVIFTYSNNILPSIDNISLEIKSNSIVGIVGSTGAGKSTIVDLLSGLLTPTSGQILIDKIPLKSNNVESWQNH